MRTLIEDRVEQALMLLRPNDAEKVNRVLSAMERENFEKLSERLKFKRLQTPGEQVFIFEATPKLRMIVKYGEDQTLVVEDIVSSELLAKVFAGNRDERVYPS